MIQDALPPELILQEVSGKKSVPENVGIFPCNPTSDKARQVCAAEMARIAGVRDFVDDTCVKREWMYAICDAGAMAKSSVYATTGREARIAWCLGAGHVDQCLLTVVWRLGWTLYSGIFTAAATAVGYNPRSMDKVRHMGDNWRRRDVLSVAREAVLRKLVREELQKEEEEQGNMTDSELLSRLRISDDTNRNSLVMFFLDILGAYELQLAAQRHNKYVYFACAMKQLLPLLYARGNHQYGPLIVWEYYTYMHRAPARIGLDFLEFWCHQSHEWGGGEGYDFFVEEENKRYLNILTDDSEGAHKLAAWMTATSQELRTDFFRDSGMRLRKDAERSATQISGAVDATETWLEEHEMSTWMSSADILVPGVTIETIFNHGKNSMATHVPQLFQAWHNQTPLPQFPSRIPITRQESGTGDCEE